MSRARKVLSTCCILVVLALPLAAAPSPEDIAKAVRQLGADDFDGREKASRFLWEAGKAAEPALLTAAKNKDPEIARRAGEILEKFKYGIYPDTPRKLVDLVERYRAGDAEGRQKVVGELIDEGKHGYGILRKLAAAEENADERRTLLRQIAEQAQRGVARLVIDGDFAFAEELLESSVSSEHTFSIQNYVAFQMLRGQLDDTIRRYQGAVNPPDAKQTAEVLAYLHKAKGDLKGALQAAEKAGNPELVQDILEQQGDWKKLAAFPPKINEQKHRDSTLGVIYQRLAGNKEREEKLLAQLLNDIKDDDSWDKTTTLLFDDRLAEALKQMRQRKTGSDFFDILCARMEFQEALDWIDRPRADEDKNRPPPAAPAPPAPRAWRQVEQAKLVHQLGEQEKAAQILARLGDSLKDVEEQGEHTLLIKAEFELNLEEQAMRHAAVLLNKQKEGDENGALEGLVGSLADGFAKDGQAPQLWWQVLRHKHPQEKLSETFARVRQTLTGKLAVKDFAALLKEMEDAAQGQKPDEQEKWFRSLAETCLGLNHDALGVGYLEKAAEVDESTRTLIRLGDVHAEKQRWAHAAQCYGQAWEKDPKEAVPLYLLGWALTHAGQEEAGRKRMQWAELLPLGDEGARFSLAQAMSDHASIEVTLPGPRALQAEQALTDASLRQQEHIQRLGLTSSVYVTNALDRLCAAASARREFPQATDYRQLSVLSFLHSSGAYTESKAYWLVPLYVHRYRARALAAAGKLDEAQKEADQYFTFLPADILFTIELVRDLEKQKVVKEAEAAFDRSWKKHVDLVQAYPNSGWMRNNLAWLAARCHRHLDTALENARKAVELRPDEHGYRDTLAEVQFQRGEDKEAIENMKKCIEAAPKNTYYRKQLERFQAGDRTAEVPEER